MPSRQFARLEIRPGPVAGPYVAVVTDLPFDLRQQFAAKHSNDFHLFPLEIAFPVVVDIGRSPGTRVEQAIPKAANQAEPVAGRMGGEDRGGERLDAVNDRQDVVSIYPNITHMLYLANL